MCCLSGRKSQRLQQHPCSPWDILCSSPYKTLFYLVLLEPSEDDFNNSDLKVLLLGLRWILRNAIPPRGCCLVAESCPTLVRWWTAAHQALLSTGFPRQEYQVAISFSIHQEVDGRDFSKCMGRLTKQNFQVEGLREQTILKTGSSGEHT